MLPRAPDSAVKLTTKKRLRTGLKWQMFRNQRRALLNTIMNCQVITKSENLLIILTTISFSVRTLFHAVNVVIITTKFNSLFKVKSCWRNPVFRNSTFTYDGTIRLATYFRFESRPGHRLNFFLIFLNPSRKMLVWYSTVNLPNPFKLSKCNIWP